MNNTIADLKGIIDTYTPLLINADKNGWTLKPQPGKWSKQEELGHLIDSAQNNIRRFIVAQHEDKPYIVYQQDKWVTTTNYQNYPVDDLITLWTLLNRHICIILSNTNPENETRLVQTQEIHSIAWLAADYNKHLSHHLHHILEMESIAYP